MPKEDISIYRDDSLCVLHKTLREAENTKEKLHEWFKKLGITLLANITVVDLLDVTLDLAKKKHRPYSKPGNTQLYVHKESIHPPTDKKHIP